MDWVLRLTIIESNINSSSDLFIQFAMSPITKMGRIIWKPSNDRISSIIIEQNKYYACIKTHYKWRTRIHKRRLYFSPDLLSLKEQSCHHQKVYEIHHREDIFYFDHIGISILVAHSTQEEKDFPFTYKLLFYYCISKHTTFAFSEANEKVGTNEKYLMDLFEFAVADDATMNLWNMNRLNWILKKFLGGDDENLLFKIQ